ncbi:MAG: hypothetical protein WCY98_06390 [Castellaniella sp.]
MIVLFIVAIVGTVALLYYWSQTVSTTRQDYQDQRELAELSEGRAQFLLDESHLLWEQLLLLETLGLSGDRHRLAFELNLLLPYLWQPQPNPFYAKELRIKAEPLVKAIDDPVISRLWAEGTLESINRIPLTLIGQVRDAGYDPNLGQVRQHDRWYPTWRLWSDED